MVGMRCGSQRVWVRCSHSISASRSNGLTVRLTRCAQRDSSFLGTDAGGLLRGCSEQTARKIEQEVRKLLVEAYKQARQTIEQHRDKLDRIGAELLEQKTLGGDTFRKLRGLHT